MQTSRRIAAGIAASLAWLAAAAAQESTPPTRGAVTIFPGALEQAAPPDGVEAPREHGWHVDGRHYAGGDGWRALVCEDAGRCRVEAVRMDVRELPIQPHYEEARPAQFLTWQPAPAGSVLLFFRPADGQPIAAGPVRTFLRPGTPPAAAVPAPAGVGTMATAIALGAEGTALLVPRLGRSTDPDRPGEEVRIELRAYGRRQLLDRYDWYEGFMAPIAARDYLVWAGDLDGDGRLDLVMNWRDYDVGQTLYLSGLAQGDEIVGEAGSFFYWPPQLGD